MNSNFQTIKFSNPDQPEQDPSQPDLLEGWPRLSALLAGRNTLAVLAILTTLGLMLAFHQIVLGAVAQGELLQQARNLQGEAFLRCNGLRGSAERDNCLRQAHPKDSAGARR